LKKLIKKGSEHAVPDPFKPKYVNETPSATMRWTGRRLVRGKAR